MAIQHASGRKWVRRGTWAFCLTTAATVLTMAAMPEPARLDAPVAVAIQLRPVPHAPIMLASFEVVGLGRDVLTALNAHPACMAEALTVALANEPFLAPSRERPLHGSHSIVSNAVRFTPNVPLKAASTYRVRFDPVRFPAPISLTAGPIEALFHIP